jgi:hypothetical protein
MNQIDRDGVGMIDWGSRMKKLKLKAQKSMRNSFLIIKFAAWQM